MKSAGLSAPSICDVFERDKIGSCGYCADALTRVTTRQVGLSVMEKVINVLSKQSMIDSSTL
jgi:hypothetical protein